MCIFAQNVGQRDFSKNEEMRDAEWKRQGAEGSGDGDEGKERHQLF